MSTLYVTEYARLMFDVAGAAVAAPYAPAVAEQNVPIGASSAQSSPFSGGTKFVQVHTDSICSIAIGPNPTAVTTAHRMGANETRF